MIIRALRRASPEGIAGTDLARELGLTRGAIWARMDVLRSAGFEIEASPHYGYRLVSGPANLVGDDIAAQLESSRIIGHNVQVYRETSSTNELADRLARGGAAEGTVIMAERQTAGKGRMGRQWICPGNRSLLFSLILRPVMRPTEVARLTLLAACSVSKALRNLTNARLQIKWPNDVHFEDRKLAGILTEMRADMDQVEYVIVGIGVNILHQPEDFPPEIRDTATSLIQIAGTLPPRSTIAARILDQIDRDLTFTRTHGFEQCLDEWKSMSCTLGRWIDLRVGSNVYSGQAERIDESGALWIRGESGKLMQFNGGEVTTQKDMTP